MRRLTQRIRRWHLVALGAVAVVAVAGTALASTLFSVGQMADVHIRTSTTASSTQSNTFVDLPASSITVTIPQQGGWVRGRFSAESECDQVENGSPPTICSVRMVVGGKEMNPKSGLDYAFDSNPSPCCNHPGDPEAASDERISDKLAAGTYTAKVQFAVSGCGSSCSLFTLDDWTFSLEVFPGPAPS